MPCRPRSTPANWQTLRGAEDQDGEVDGGPDLSTVFNGLGAKPCRKNSETATTPEAALHASTGNFVVQHEPASSCIALLMLQLQTQAPGTTCCGIAEYWSTFPPRSYP